MSDWDASDIEEPQIVIPTKVKSKWDEEDADEGIKESWEESDEETKPKVVEAKKKIPLAQKIAEREAREKAEKAKKALEERLDSELTPEELKAKKEKQKKLQEESDLQNAADLFGGISLDDKPIEASGNNPIELIKERELKTKAEFDNFGKEISELILKYKANRNYASMTEALVRAITEPLKDVELRKISSSLTAAANEKQRAAKEALKGKKKGAKKSNVKVEVENSELTRGVGAYDDDDYDDFM